MKRSAFNYLQNWLDESLHKPIVLRGARQVGKTWLVRQLAKENDLRLVELNFEHRPELESLFVRNDPEDILKQIEASFEIIISPEKSLLFLDEIQAAPHLLAKLRWFSESMPELAVIAAGSLLEFVLEEHHFSMPVGRISYLHLEPLSFNEFLLAKGKEKLSEYLFNYTLTQSIPALLHQQFMNLFKEYLIVGGMPAAVASWVNKHSLAEVNKIHYDLLATYRDDFSKYADLSITAVLEEVMSSVPKQLAEKFIYSKVDKTIPAAKIKRALHLLSKARLCHRIRASYGNGVPLGAELNPRYLKMIFLDVGLTCVQLGLKTHHFATRDDTTLVNSGGIIEQVVGQLLRTVEPLYVEPELFYWTREQQGSAAEVDYLLQHENTVIPIEVKAGSTGSLKSLHIYMALKKLKCAVRINADFPSVTPVNVKTQLQQDAQYTLLSIPLYLVERIHELREYGVKSRL